MPETFLIDEALAGTRLDCALCSLLPGLSLRTARRMTGDSRILLNGRPARSAVRIRAGQVLEILNAPRACSRAPQARLLAARDGFFFFYKPPGLHSAALAGRANASLAQAVPALLAEKGFAPDIILLQRLDFGTAGIILGAASVELAQAYRQAEKQGLCDKYYYAALSGKLARARTVKNALDCRGGSGVRTLEREAKPLRWTIFQPLAWQDGLTLARCHLKMGQRHQIRAHAARMGHPLAGDALYGGRGAEKFLLEHYGIRFPGQEMFFLHNNSSLRALFGGWFAQAEAHSCMS